MSKGFMELFQKYINFLKGFKNINRSLYSASIKSYNYQFIPNHKKSKYFYKFIFIISIFHCTKKSSNGPQFPGPIPGNCSFAMPTHRGWPLKYRNYFCFYFAALSAIVAFVARAVVVWLAQFQV